MTKAADLPAPTPKSPVIVPIGEIGAYLELHGLEIVDVQWPKVGRDIVQPVMVVTKQDGGER